MESTNTSALALYSFKERQESAERGWKIIKEALHMPDWLRWFIRRYGIALLALAVLSGNTAITRAVTQYNTTIEVTERLTAQYDAEYDAKIQAFYDAQAEANAIDGIDEEADAIARAIGTMETKRQKLTMVWNILARVDSPYYPNTVADVIAQPIQWMFYDEKNPIKDDDRELVLEQLRLWHAGRYPAGFSAKMVYGEWSTKDYVCRDTWEKNSSTNYWRFPE